MVDHNYHVVDFHEGSVQDGTGRIDKSRSHLHQDADRVEALRAQTGRVCRSISRCKVSFLLLSAILTDEEDASEANNETNDLQGYHSFAMDEEAQDGDPEAGRLENDCSQVDWDEQET